MTNGENQDTQDPNSHFSDLEKTLQPDLTQARGLMDMVNHVWSDMNNKEHFWENDYKLST